MRTEIELDAGRGPILVKRAASAAEAERLAEEALALTAAQHPGVVALAGFDPDASPVELRTRWAGPHTLDTISRPTAAEVAGLVAGVADTIADLHARGLTHGRLTPDHVVIDGDGRPILCGLRGAASIHRYPPADDVAAIGRLLSHLLSEPEGGDLEPIPERRRATRSARWQGYDRRSLLLLADQASAPDPASRPSARALASAVQAAVPPPSAGRRSAATPAAWGRQLRAQVAKASSGSAAHRPARLGAAAVVAVVAGLVLRSLALGPASTAATARPSPDVEATSSAPFTAPVTADGTTAPAVPPTTTPHRPSSITTTTVKPLAAPTAVAAAPTTSSPGSVAMPSTEPSGAAADQRSGRSPRCDDPGDSGSSSGSADLRCGRDLRVEQGSVIIGETVYRLGSAEDTVVVANWGCAPLATPALLRAGTGEVFVFREWAQPAQPVEVEAIAVVDDATGLEATDRDGDGCVDLAVKLADGPPLVLATGDQDDDG